MTNELKRVALALIGCVVLCAMIFTGASMAAIVDSGTCGDNLTWSLTDDGTLSISGTGDMYDYNWDTQPWGAYRYSLNRLTLPNGLTKIGNYAFYGCNHLTGNLAIPNTVTEIGNYTFSECSGFSGTLDIPYSVKTIGEHAFFECSGFSGNLVLSNNLTTIENCAFSGCGNLTGTLIIPNNITSIEDFIFYECVGLTDVIIPQNVTNIGERPFSRCDNLTAFFVDSNNSYYSSDSQGILYNKDKTTLIGCPSAKNGYLAISSSVTEIGYGAFDGCSRLIQVYIPASVDTIVLGAFSGENGITTIIVDSNNLYYSSDNQGILYNKDKSMLLTCPNNRTGTLTIPLSVRTIMGWAFSGNSGLTGPLTIPESVTYIGQDAFVGCSGFTGNLVIPSNVTTIEVGAFTGCSGFSGSLIIPDNVTIINNWAFSGCNNLTGTLIIPNSVKSIGDGSFASCIGLNRIILPSNITEIGRSAFVNLHQDSIIYAECSELLLEDKYSTDRTAIASHEIDNSYKFTVYSSSFPLTNENAPVNENYSFAGWYTTSSCVGEKVSSVSNGQTLYAKWISDDLKLYPGWNVISVPKQLTSVYDTAAELFTDVDTEGHAILTYNASTKTWEQIMASTKITPLNAYWLYSNESKTLPYEFSSSVSSPAVKNVYKGWNAVSLSADEPLSAALTFGNTDWYTYLEWNASTQGFKKPIIKGGTGEYADTNLVSLWTGGWLFLNEDGTYMGFTA